MIQYVSAKTVDSDLARIVHNCKDNVMETASKRAFDHTKDEYPSFHAVAKGFACMNCGKSDIDISQCPCEKAYFCNEECQAAKWAEHEKEHKKITLRLDVMIIITLFS